MGKGSAPRPYSVDAQTFASNWDAIFNRGVAERSKASGSNPDNGQCHESASHTVGSNPTAPAKYVDDATGSEVDEAWWPGDPVWPAQGNEAAQPSLTCTARHAGNAQGQGS